MGENALFYQKHIQYPCLVKPYQKETGSIDRNVVESCAGTERKIDYRMNELSTIQKQKYDPFSRYDDDLGEDHYFLVPETDGNNLRVSEWRRTVKSSRSLKNIAKLASDIQHVETTVGKNRTKTYPPYYNTPKTLEREVDMKKLAGDYCYISADLASKEKNLFGGTSSRTSSFHRRKDGERLEDFASKFANIGDEIPKPQSSSHSFEGRKFDTWVELEGISETDRKTRLIRTQPEKVIDYCTCMICVKGIFYHCSDDDDIVENVCSCSGSKGKVLKRWTCLSILACFMPCLFCYLPAKGCLNLCRTCKSKDKRSGDCNLRARYKKHNEQRLRETTTLL